MPYTHGLTIRTNASLFIINVAILLLIVLLLPRIIPCISIICKNVILFLFLENEYEAAENIFLGRLYSPAFTSPRTMRHIADKTHPEGYDLELPCKATGMHPLVYSWFVNEVRFKRKYRMNIKNTGSRLKIQRLRARDSGVYTCVASNKYGNLSFSYPLKVRGTLGLIIFIFRSFMEWN